MPQLRSIWKGHIRFSLVTIPIRIYNAVDTAQANLATVALIACWMVGMVDAYRVGRRMG